MKVSSDYEALAHEIKVLKKVRSEAKNSSHTSFPEVIKYGMLNCINLHEKDVKANKKSSNVNDSSGAYGYYIMPKYEMSLSKYIGKNGNNIKPDTILKIV